MYKNSKIISFFIDFGDMIDKASRDSFLCKLIMNFVRFFRNTWRDSFFGQIVSSMFNVEVHRHSLAYKVISGAVMGFLSFINRIFKLEQGISDSKYFALIKYSEPKMNNIERDESPVKVIFKDSVIMRYIYGFWINME